MNSNRIPFIRPLTSSLLLSAALLTAAPAAEPPLAVHERVELAANPSRTWDTIQDFRGWQAWHPAFAKTEITRGDGIGEGSVRVLTAKDGAKFTEELVSHDTTARTYRYRIIDSPLPITDYVSTLRVKASKSGSIVTWSSIFHVKPQASAEEIRRTISSVYRTGLDNLAAATN